MRNAITFHFLSLFYNDTKCQITFFWSRIHPRQLDRLGISRKKSFGSVLTVTISSIPSSHSIHWLTSPFLFLWPGEKSRYFAVRMRSRPSSSREKAKELLDEEETGPDFLLCTLPKVVEVGQCYLLTYYLLLEVGSTASSNSCCVLERRLDRQKKKSLSLFSSLRSVCFSFLLFQGITQDIGPSIF